MSSTHSSVTSSSSKSNARTDDIIDLDNYDDSQTNCVDTFSNGMQFVCVDDQCKKHHPKSTPVAKDKDLGLIDLCDSDDEANSAIRNYDGSSLQQTLVSTSSKDVSHSNMPSSSSVQCPLHGLAKRHPALSSLINSKSNLVTSPQPSDVHVSSSVNDSDHHVPNILRPRAKSSCPEYSSPVTSQIQSPGLVSSTNASFNQTFNAVSYVPSPGSGQPTSHTSAIVSSSVKPINNNSQAPARKPRNEAPSKQSASNSKDKSPTSDLVHPPVSNANGMSMQNSPNRAATSSVSLSVPKAYFSFAAEQLRATTKLSKKIVDYFYDVLVNQPYVVIRPLTGSDIRGTHCPWCSKIFVHEKSLVYHINMVHQKRQMPVKCPECTMKFKELKFLTEHMDKKHSGCGSLGKCDICNKYFKSSIMNRHKLKRHNITPTYECVKCSLKFNTNEQLAIHEKYSHNPSPKSLMTMIKQDIGIATPEDTCSPRQANVGHNSENKSNKLQNGTVKSEQPLVPICEDSKTINLVNGPGMSSSVSTTAPASITAIRTQICDLLKAFKKKENLPKKVNKVEYCGLCKEKFVHQRERDMHFRDTHGEDKMPLHCLMCNRGYFSDLVLLKHYKLSHVEMFKQVTDILERTAASTAHLNSVQKSLQHVKLSPDLLPANFIQSRKRKCSELSDGSSVSGTNIQYQSNNLRKSTSIAPIEISNSSDESSDSTKQKDVTDIKAKTTPDSHLCTFCSKMFLTEYGKQCHIREHHS